MATVGGAVRGQPRTQAILSALHSPVRPSSPPDGTGLHGCSPSGGLDWTDPVRRIFGLDGLQSTAVDCQALSKLLGRVFWIEGELETRAGAEREEIVIVQYRSKRYYCRSSSQSARNISAALMSSRVPAISPSLCQLRRHSKASRASSPI